jgi:hypothetical protein
MFLLFRGRILAFIIRHTILYAMCCDVLWGEGREQEQGVHKGVYGDIAVDGRVSGQLPSITRSMYARTICLYVRLRDGDDSDEGGEVLNWSLLGIVEKPC